MGCDMPIHYYLGFGQNHPDNFHKTLQVKLTSPHTVRATFKQFDGHRVGADFTLKCTENRCLIDDFKMIGDRTSIKTDYKLVLRKQNVSEPTKQKGCPNKWSSPLILKSRS